MTHTHTELDLNPQRRLANLLDAIERGEMLPVLMADWYEEHGEPLKAEYVRVACELEKCGPKPRELFVADGAGTRMEGLGVALTPRGDGHYSASSAERGLSTETFTPNERVDIYAHLARKDRIKWMRGMKYVKHVPERQEIIFRKDEQSGPWKGTTLTARRNELLRTLTATCPGCEGKGIWKRIGNTTANDLTCTWCGGSGDLLCKDKVECDHCGITGWKKRHPNITPGDWALGCPKCAGTGRVYRSRLTPHLDLYASGLIPEVRLVPCEVGALGGEQDEAVDCRACGGDGGGGEHGGEWECGACGGSGLSGAVVSVFTRSPWAAAVAKLPHIRGFRVTDREPDLIGDHPQCCWIKHRDGVEDTGQLVPGYLFDRLEGGVKEKAGQDWIAYFGGEDEWCIYATPELAHAALSVAALAVVRGKAG